MAIARTVFVMETGRAFGVLERGGFASDGRSMLHGITKAEAVHALVDDGSIQRLRKAVLPEDGVTPLVFDE